MAVQSTHQSQQHQISFLLGKEFGRVPHPHRASGFRVTLPPSPAPHGKEVSFTQQRLGEASSSQGNPRNPQPPPRRVRAVIDTDVRPACEHPAGPGRAAAASTPDSFTLPRHLDREDVSRTRTGIYSRPSARFADFYVTPSGEWKRGKVHMTVHSETNRKRFTSAGALASY